MKLLSILILTLASSYSFAGNHNEAVWQADADKNAVSLGYNYSSLGFQLKSSPSAGVKTNINRISADYERGLNDMFSIGAGFDYISISDGGGFDAAGIENLSLTFKGNNHLGFAGLYYGVNANIGLGDNKTDSDGANNASLGRMEFIPHIALVMGDRKMGYGLKVKYIFRTEKTETNEAPPSTESKYEDGNTIGLKLFFEKTLNDKSLFGADLGYAMTAFETGENGNDFSSETNVFALNLYGAITCGCQKSSLTFLPKVTYFMGTGESSSGNDIETTGGSYAVEFALRKVF